MDRKALRREFKEKKTPKGVFAVCCTPTAQVWVGGSTHLDSEKTSLWFQLRNGPHLNVRLGEAWMSQGEEAFSFDVLEILDEDVSPLALKDLLKERVAFWTEKLGALKA